jgi:hypothetical protein
MSWVLELASNIPAFLTYVVPGYLFLAVYRYMLFKDEDSADKTSSLLLNSVIISFVLKTLYDLIAAWLQPKHETLYLIGIILLSILAGFGSAKLVVGKCAAGFFKKLGDRFGKVAEWAERTMAQARSATATSTSAVSQSLS